LVKNLKNRRSSKAVRTLDAHTNIVMCVAFSPDSALLASSSGDGTVKLFDRLAVPSLFTTATRTAADALATNPIELRTLSGSRHPVRGLLTLPAYVLSRRGFRQLAAAQHPEQLGGEFIPGRPARGALCCRRPAVPGRWAAPWRVLLPGAVEPVDDFALGELLAAWGRGGERFLTVVWCEGGGGTAAGGSAVSEV